MINAEFQELKRRFSVNVEERVSIMEQMRENLIARNGGNSTYEFGYTSGDDTKTVDIKDIDKPEPLFEIDGDMCPRGL